MKIEELENMLHELTKFRNKLSPEIIDFKLNQKYRHLVTILAGNIDTVMGNIVKLKNCRT